MTKELKKQKTLAKPISFQGIGIHTGDQVNLRFVPKPAGSGISFCRTDLPGKPIIPAGVEYVRDSSRSTSLGVGNALVCTVEHVLSALKAYEIDNLLIEVSAMETPIADGSSLQFVQMIEEAGITEFDVAAPVITLDKPVYYSEEGIHIVALPSDDFRISYTLSYPGNDILKAQYYALTVNAETFKKELASARTFSRYQEIAELMDRGLIKGGSLSNAVVIDGDTVYSMEGLRYPEEMARHKILDLIGDISLVGFNFNAHIIAIRSGHSAHLAFAKVLLKSITAGKST